MDNFLKEISNWSSSMKLGTAIALGGVVLLGTSILYANSQTTTSNTTISNESITVEPIVNEEIEEIIRPYTVNCDVAHYFYEETDTVEMKEKSIVSVPGSNRTYMLSEGCDYTYNGDTFSIVSSVSGVVSDKLIDPTFGNVVIVSHESGTKFIYSSLSECKVNKGQEVVQGDIIGISGTSLYTSELGNSLHFEIVKEGKHLNPEKLYSTSVEQL